MTASERLARFVHELDLAAIRVRAREHAKLCLTTDRAPTHLEVVLRSCARHVLDVDYPRGSPKNPATRAELLAKFDALASPVFPARRLAEIKATLSALEHAPSIHDLARLCVQAVVQIALGLVAPA